MKRIAIGLGLWASLSGCASSGGTETDNPARTLKDFSSSRCKTKAPSGEQQLGLLLESDLDGLQCVEWERGAAGTLSLRLTNFPEPCADEYHGRAELDGQSSLSLSVYKDYCAVAACGSCLFDFDFELSGVSELAPLSLRTGSAECASSAVAWENQLILPLDQQPSGSRCRALASGPLGWYAQTRDLCGERNMPCGDCSMDQKTCDPGLTCSELAPGDARCLVSCESDADCVAGATSCRGGVCAAAADF